MLFLPINSTTKENIMPSDYGHQDRERQEREKRERGDKDRQTWQQQGDAEFEKVKVTIEKVKVDVPANVRGKLDEVLQSIQSLIQHYKNQPTQLPADPNNPQAGTLPAQPGQQPQPSNPMAPGGTPQPK
jgi:hypothetical protein